MADCCVESDSKCDVHPGSLQDPSRTSIGLRWAGKQRYCLDRVQSRETRGQGADRHQQGFTASVIALLSHS